MFEQLLSAVPLRAFPPVPDSGPGPSTLRQWDEATQAGFFGSIPAGQFITQPQIEALAAAPLTGTLTNQANQTWLKYIYQDKILYIPTRTFRSGITWDVLYRAGFAYGLNGPGAYPALSGPVNQKRIVEFVDATNRIWRYYVRIVKVATVDPFSDLTATAPQIRQSEYTCLVERTFPTVGIDLPWATYGSPSQPVHGLNSRVTYTEYNILANGNSNAYTRNFNAKVTAAGWLPVLELITDPEEPIIPDTAAPGQVEFRTPGTTTWTVPAGVNSVSFVVVGAGQSGGAAGGDSGGLRYQNNMRVVPGETYVIVVGSGQGANDAASITRVSSALGLWTGIGEEGSKFTDKVRGGYGSQTTLNFHNNGGNTGTYDGGTSYQTRNTNAGTFIGGMGTDLYGQANSRTQPNASVGGTPGAGGGYMAKAGNGAVRIIWGDGRSFPDAALNV